MNRSDVVERIRRYLWHLDRQTRRTLRMHPKTLVELSPTATDRERELATRLLSDGGEREGDGGEREGDGESGGGGDDDGSAFDVDEEYGLRNKAGLVLGPLLFVVLLLAPNPSGLSPAGQAVGASTAWVATWWISEAAPIPATSLLPLVLFPLTGAADADATAAPYADPYIFLFLGGFFIAVSMQRWGLHRRIALRTIKAIGTQPSRIILGFMVATAFLSMWVSNTATTMMMTPIGLAVVVQAADLVEEQGPDISVERGEFRFGTVLMLCIAYAASIGGVGTLIGTPPNIVLAGAISNTFNRDISFAQWMLYGVPIAVVGLSLVWVYMTKIYMPPQIDTIPGGIGVIDDELEKLGSMSREEKLVLVVFVATAVAWISRDFVLSAVFPAIDDSTIAIVGALALFLLPARTDDGSFTFLLDWESAVDIPWGVILLFGGGLSIAAAFEATGLAKWIGGTLSGLEGVSIVLIVGLVVTLTILLTEVTSNTATAAMLMPVLASLAVGLGVHPYGIMIAAATAASFAFMLPVATPPNAIVFGSGYITIPEMAKAGSGLNLMGIVLTVILSILWLPLVWGIDITEIPNWAT